MDNVDRIEVMNGLENMAEMTRMYYEALRSQGFNRREAMQLTHTYLHAMISTAKSDADDD